MTAFQAGLPVAGWLGIIALTVHEAVYGARHAVTCRTNKVGHRCSCWLGHRFLSGRAFHGYVVTDATYWKKANNTDGDVSPFQKLPGWQRRALRTGPVLAGFGALISWPLTAAAVATVGCCVAVRCTLRGRKLAGRAAGTLIGRLTPERLRERLGRHHGTRKHDLAGGLADITKTASVAVKPQIDWNPGYASAEAGETVVTWYPPSGFRADPLQKSKVEDLFQGRVEFEIVPAWNMAAVRPCVNFVRARSLPTLVYLKDYAADLAKLPEHQIGLGLDERGEIVCWDFNVENPHGLVVAGSRIGKTELNRSKVAQVTRRGGHVSGADCKRISFQGLEGIPGFDLRNNPRNIRGMWELIREEYEEMERRAEERERNPAVEFTRRLLTIEELGQFSEMTDDWWEEVEVEDPRDAGTLFFKPKNRRKTPRVWRYIKSVCFEGAEFMMHVDISGQDGDHKYLKGVKSVLGLRLLGGYQDNQWINCVGTRPVPQAPDIKGRFCLVNGRKQTWFQAFVGDLDKLESAAIWRDYARAGRRMDGTAPVTGSAGKPFTVTSDGIVSAGASVATLRTPGPATDVAAPMSLLEITRVFLLPRGSKDDQVKFAQMLRQDRYRSDRGDLPDDLVFPEPVAVADDGRKTELFIPVAVIAFNKARRGSPADTRR